MQLLRNEIFIQRKSSRISGCYILCSLLLYDLQNFHGASFDADATGNALGCGILGLEDHDLHGAGLNALATRDTILLIDHVHTGLGILGDSVMLTSLHALATLDAGHGLSAAVLAGNDLDAGIIRMELLVKCLGAGIDAGQASHAFYIFLNSELLHIG